MFIPLHLSIVLWFEHSGMTEMLPLAWDTRGGFKGLSLSQTSALHWWGPDSVVTDTFSLYLQRMAFAKSVVLHFPAEITGLKEFLKLHHLLAASPWCWKDCRSTNSLQVVVYESPARLQTTGTISLMDLLSSLVMSLFLLPLPTSPFVSCLFVICRLKCPTMMWSPCLNPLVLSTLFIRVSSASFRLWPMTPVVS